MSELRTDFLQLVDGAMLGSDALISVINPATGHAFAHCPSASRLQLDAAIAGAQRAFDGWRRRSFEDRRQHIGRMAEVLRYHAVDDALRRANATRFGLAGSVWSSNVARATGVANRLEVGTAWINQHRATAANVPFGGAKESGIGRHYSILGLKSNMEPRVVSLLK